MIDYSSSESLGETAGIGQSLGPTQITIKTAIENKLTNIDPNSFSTRWYLAGSTKESLFRSAVRSYLQKWQSNIDAAGKLMSKYLEEFCRKELTNGFSPSFIKDVATGVTREDLCCKKKACKDVVDLKPSVGLIKATTAAWNNGIGITNVSNIPGESPNAFNHAGWAARLVDSPVID